MNINNNCITIRWNKWLRKNIIAPKMRTQLQKHEITILCNNCIGGFVLHDLGLRFDTPTINMFFHDLDFFDFVEHFDYYIQQPLIQIQNPQYDTNAPDYPVAILQGGNQYRDLELHFLHYNSFEEANAKWKSRKSRIHPQNMYVIWTFMGMPRDEGLYLRAQNLPIKNKVIFVNHSVEQDKYPDFYYIKGFENQIGTGQLGEFMNLMGKRYYDQFDFVKWINNG